MPGLPAQLREVETDPSGAPGRFEWRGERQQVRRVLGRWQVPGVVRFGDLGRETFQVELEGGAFAELSLNRTLGSWHLTRFTPP